jgi:hypothetical protein
MNPRHFLDSYWRNDLSDTVFVATSYRDEFEPRFDAIFKPAIETADTSLGRRLVAHRVDRRRTGQSINTAIVDGIAHCQLVLVDISIQDRWEEKGSRKKWAKAPRRKRVSRNDNVMYEVGVALTCRQKEEVILVMDDASAAHPTPFDLHDVPQVRFNPENASESIKSIREEIQARLLARRYEQDLRYRRIQESLSSVEVDMLLSPHVIQNLEDSDKLFTFIKMLPAMHAQQLFAKGIIRVVQIQRGPKPVPFCELTDLGRVLVCQLQQFVSEETDAPTEADAR